MARLKLFIYELIQKQQSGAPLTPLFTGADGLRKWAHVGQTQLASSIASVLNPPSAANQRIEAFAVYGKQRLIVT